MQAGKLVFLRLHKMRPDDYRAVLNRVHDLRLSVLRGETSPRTLARFRRIVYIRSFLQ